MTFLDFKEAASYRAVRLTTTQARWLIDQNIAVVQPSYVPGCFDVRIENVAGVVSFAGLQINIEPKLPVSSLLWMLNYTSWIPQWHLDEAKLENHDLTAVMVSLLCAVIEDATKQGLLSGYWQVNTTSNVLRGRINLPEQLNRNYGALFPLEITYDEYGNNIPENQILLSALLEAQQLLDEKSRPALRERINNLLPRFEGVMPLVSGQSLPTYKRSRLNSRYFRALDFAELFLKKRGLNTNAGTTQGHGFIIDMPALFEEFVATALQETTRGAKVESQRSELFVRGTSTLASHNLRPDIVISQNQRVHLALDTKYKRASPKISDLYQLNAYADTLNIDDVTLIYGEKVAQSPPLVTQAGKRIHVRGIDLSASPEEILQQIADLVSLT